MELLVLDAQIRDGKTTAHKLRKQNVIPAVCYGKGFENHTVTVEYQAFRKLYKAASTTQVFNLNVDGKKLPVLIHEIAYNPMTDRFDHIDFLQIDMKKMVTATVPVVLTGLSPAIKNFNAVVTLVKNEIEVKCLPMDIPHEISVDTSGLENIGDAIHIKDLKLGSKVEILDEMEDTLVTVSAFEEYKENEVLVPEELKAEPTAEGEAGADGAKAEEKAEGGEEKKD